MLFSTCNAILFAVLSFEVLSTLATPIPTAHGSIFERRALDVEPAIDYSHLGVSATGEGRIKTTKMKGSLGMGVVGLGMGMGIMGMCIMIMGMIMNKRNEKNSVNTPGMTSTGLPEGDVHYSGALYEQAQFTDVKSMDV
ncbi:hypothetical protein GGX14DRAFT_560006 [Mycena pura]|uniref:Mid2 domain-containing protein n=1 Tax=Mycena pura TaxID=153505 RepID=A0AAD6VQV3_9AGAR|nr:hypothetical protein GGX14DRAFT_560006 [Mycena pura]